MAISTLDLNGNTTGTDATATFKEQNAVQLFSSATITSNGGTAGRVNSITLTLLGATATENLALDATGLSTATANGVSFNYSAGVLTLAGANTSDAIWQSILRHIVYSNTSDTPDGPTRTVTVFAIDNNSGSSLTRTDMINVTPVNDAPVVDLNGAATGTSATVNYTENDAPSVIAPSAIVTDINSADFNGGSLRVAFTQNGTIADQLSIKADATVSMSGNTVSVNGTAIGSVSGGNNGSDLVVSFNGSATPALVTLLLQHIGYSSSSDAPSTAARTVKFTMIDGDGTALGGQDTGFATATIQVTAVNDRPVVNDVVANGNEDANSTSVKLTGTDVDGTVTSFKVTGPLPDASQGTLYTNSTMTHAVVSGTSYAASGANALTLYFKPTANYNGTVIFNYTATDNSGADAASATATINVASVNDAPKIISNGGTNSVTLSVAENTTAVTTVQATDVDTPTLTYSIVGGADAAKFTIGASGALTFITAPDFENRLDTLANNSYVVKVQASDGSLTDTQTITVKVMNVNEAPVVDLNGAAPSDSVTLAYAANNPLKVIAPSATVADVDSPNFNGGALRVSFSQNGTAGDQLAIKTDATVTLSGSSVKIGGTIIGTVSGGANGADLVIAFTNNNATPARVTTLLEHIGYSNSSPNPLTSTKMVNFTVIDGDGGSQDTGIASATINVTGTNGPPTGAVTITGTPTEDQTLTASNTLNDADGLGSITYHWLRGGVDTGATGSTYVLGDADVGAQISVRANYIDGHGTAEAVTSAATAAVANVNDAPTGAVTITGTPTEDQTLTASSNTLNDADGLGSITYHWLRGGVDTGATGSTYVLGDADVGAQISVRANYIDGHGTAEAVTSAATAAVANVNDAPTGAVTIAGTPTEDQTLTASSNTLNDADGLGSITYHWLRGGVDTGATGSTYVLGDADVGAQISVRANYIDGHGTAEAVTSAATAAVANLLTSDVSVFLTVNPDFLAPSSIDTTVSATALTLNSSDQLSGGLGHDILALFGTGTFDLTGLSAFSGFEQVALYNPQGQGGLTNLYLPAGQDIDVDATNSSQDVIYLSSGATTIDGSGATSNQYYLSSGTATINEGAGSGYNHYYLSSGTATINATSPSADSTNYYVLSSGNATITDSHQVLNFQANGAGNASIVQDLNPYLYDYAGGSFALSSGQTDITQDFTRTSGVYYYGLNDNFNLSTGLYHIDVTLNGLATTYNYLYISATDPSDFQSGDSLTLTDNTASVISTNLNLSGNHTFDLSAIDSVTNFQIANFSLNNGAILNADASLAGITQIFGDGTGALKTADATLDLTSLHVAGASIESTNAVGTTFTVADAATGLNVIGGVGDDVLLGQGFAFTQAQRQEIFYSASIETIIDSSGTYIAPAVFHLTTGADTLVGFPDSTVVTGSTSTLTSDDQLNGLGHDILALFGTGTFDLTGLSAFSGFEQVALYNPQGQGGLTNLYLPAGQDIDVDATNSSQDVIYLSSGATTIDGSGATSNQYYLSSGTATINEGAGSGYNHYYLSSGTATINATSPSADSTNYYVLSSGNATITDSHQVLNFQANGAGNASIVQDLNPYLYDYAGGSFALSSGQTDITQDFTRTSGVYYYGLNDNFNLSTGLYHIDVTLNGLATTYNYLYISATDPSDFQSGDSLTLTDNTASVISTNLNLSGNHTFDLSAIDSVTNFQIANFSLNNGAILNADASLAGITQIFGDGTGALKTADATLDLTSLHVAGASIESTNAVGTTFTVADAATGLNVIGGVGDDVLLGQGFAFTQAQRALIFTQGSVEVIQDASGEYGSSGDNVLKAYVGGMMTGGSGANSFVFSQSNLGLNTITDFVPGADHLEISASGFGGGLTAGAVAPLVSAADIASVSNLGNSGYFIFDNAGPNSGTVYWDQDGGSGANAVPVAILTGVNSLLPSDFHLV